MVSCDISASHRDVDLNSFLLPALETVSLANTIYYLFLNLIWLSITFVFYFLMPTTLQAY